LLRYKSAIGFATAKEITMAARANIRRVRPIEVAPARTERAPVQLPPAGASPAGDLQRRVSDAALRGFYSPTKTPRWRGRSQLVLVLGTVGLCWATVFGLGAVFLY
jgi:hypothetical protein